MKHIMLSISISFFLLHECYPQKTIDINEHLKNSSTKWAVEKKKNKNWKLFKGKTDITFYQFGPYKIFQAEIDTVEFDTRDQSFKMPPLFRERTTSFANKFYRIMVSHGADTAEIIFCRWLRSINERKGIIDFGKDPVGHTSIDSITATIRINNDSVAWRFVSTFAPFERHRIEATYKYYKGVFPVDCIDLFEGRSKPSPYGSVSKGATIRNSDEEHLAAVQLDGKKYVWLKTGLSAELNLAMASCIILILCNLEL